MSKLITKAEDSKEQILKAVDTICNPVRQTLTPRGGNVLFTANGQVVFSNDGITIADAVEVDDPLEQAIIDIIKQASRSTNNSVGDGTTTTLIFAQALIKEGMKLIEDGWNPMVLKNQLLSALPLIIKELDSLSISVLTNKDLEYVANVSSSNDKEIAKNVVDAVKSAGEDGLIFLEDSPRSETVVKKNQGYFMESGLYSPLLTNTSKMEARYTDVKVLVTDKRIYHGKEAITIMDQVLDAGFKDVVIVARDFIGQAPNVFIANHTKGNINVLLVKDTEATDTNSDSLEDLAAYLGANFISEKKGEKTFDVSIKDFGTVSKVISNRKQTIFYGDTGIMAKHRVTALKEILKDAEEEEEDDIKKRIARMTRGAITIVVGGNNPAETKEKVYRYEDAVNATRNANKHGYVTGGGITPYIAYKNAVATPKWKKEVHPDVADTIKTAVLAPLRQVATNCNINFGTLISKIDEKGLGYNAVTEKYVDLRKDGIIEPLDVPKLSLTNAISVTNIILTSRYLMIDKKEKKDE